MRIDAHAHVWRRSRTPQPWIDPVEKAVLDRDFMLAELVDMQAAAGVDASVLVQSANSAQETRDLLAMAKHPAVAGVVGWVDLLLPVAQQLQEYGPAIAAGELFGIRHLIHQDPDSLWMTRPELTAGLRELARHGLVFDLVLRPEQIPMATGLVKDQPQTQFVVDHLGKPPIASGDLEAWRRDIAALGSLPNVTAKLSGLTTEADWKMWTAEQVGAAVDHALEVFGPHRLMFGSDWPVALLAGQERTWPELLSQLCGHLDGDSQAAIFGGTAQEIYKGSTREK
ncbi:amidohydrolase family protein [Arthrobacter sp. HLT1-20]